MTWRFPDIEKLAVAYLSTATGAQRVVTTIPAQSFTANLPLLRVARGPGSDDTITDAPLLDVEALAPSRGDAWNLAENARQAMHALAGAVVNGVLVDSVSTATAPVFVEYSPTVARFVASYRLRLRGQQ